MTQPNESHIEDAVLSEYAENEVSTSEVARIADHLAHCQQCSDALESIRKAQSLLKQLPEHQPRRNIAEGVERRIRRRSRGRFFNSGWTANNRITYLAAVIILLILAALYLLGQAPDLLRDSETGKTADELKPDAGVILEEEQSLDPDP